MVGTPRRGYPVHDIMNEKNNKNNKNKENEKNENKNEKNNKNKDSEGHKTDRHGDLSVPQLKAKDLFDVIYYLKSFTTHRYIESVEKNNWDRFYKKVWHHSYYEHIIRNKREFYRIENYIRLNPKNWKKKKLIV